jgi:GNAT superfamily N-acetyltransferase
MEPFEPIRIASLDPAELTALREECRREGFGLLDRLADDYLSGANRFDRPGEALFGIYTGRELVGIGGLNRDPYANDPRVGRVRRVYIAAAYRRRGLGRRLIGAIVAEASRHYDVLVLKTDTARADAFYRALGFQAGAAPGDATHVMRLEGQGPREC